MKTFTEKQKRILIVVTIVVVGLIFLLMGKKNNALSYSPFNMGDVQIPGFDYVPRDVNISIPGLPSGSPYGFSPVSACGCGGQSLTPISETFINVNETIQQGPTYSYSPVQSYAGGMYVNDTSTGYDYNSNFGYMNDTFPI